MMEISQAQREALRKPLPEEAIKPHPTKSYLSTIKAIYVTERLSDVFGVNGWHIKTDLIHWFEKVKKSAKGEYTEFTALCKTTITVPAYGIIHECVAGSSNEDLGDATKGATTDAITKIGSYLEIGIDVFKGLKPQPKPTAPKSEAPKPAAKTPAKSPKPEPKQTPSQYGDLLPGTKNWDYSTKKLEKGETTVDYLKTIFNITPENETTLRTHEKAKATA
jgi:hypothetical protein